jgi:hypothetical protein
MLTCPAPHASVAAVRDLKMRAAHSQRSIRTESMPGHYARLGTLLQAREPDMLKG